MTSESVEVRAVLDAAKALADSWRNDDGAGHFTHTHIHDLVAAVDALVATSEREAVGADRLASASYAEIDLVAEAEHERNWTERASRATAAPPWDAGKPYVGMRFVWPVPYEVTNLGTTVQAVPFVSAVLDPTYPTTVLAVIQPVFATHARPLPAEDNQT